MNMNPEQVQRILEAALLVAGRPMSAQDLQKLFDESDAITTKEIRELLLSMQEQYADKGIELRELASGFQYQAKAEYSPWLSRLWEERAPRYSRAVLETIALIAYRQPITRSEIEEIRGVAVSSNIIKTLQEREWIKVVGYRDVPGKPALFATTKTFLDHLNLKALDELPALSEVLDLEGQEQKLQVQLELSATPETTETDTSATDEDTQENATDNHDNHDNQLSDNRYSSEDNEELTNSDTINAFETEESSETDTINTLDTEELTDAEISASEASLEKTETRDTDSMDFSPEDDDSTDTDDEIPHTSFSETSEQATTEETHQPEYSETE